MVSSAISLLELNLSIRDSLMSTFPETYWVVAEINDYKINRSGHCYLELIEKQKDFEAIVAKSRATIWANTFRMIRPYFETSTGRSLSEGLKIMVNVTVEFHEIYGLSLNILDIEPEYTIGDMARQRAETISRLEKEGVINMNKELELPLVPQKIAIVSSANAAGYKDFINQLENNPYGYVFYKQLFPAIMQGDAAEASIINALEAIYNYEHFFETVVIIRGGGSKSDLQCFDNYWLAANIAQFPLPVLTGIGHEQDESIADLIAYKKLKTPTAVAEFLINRAADFEGRLIDSQNQLLKLTNQTLTFEHYKIKSISEQLPAVIRNILLKKQSFLNNTTYQFNTLSKKYISQMHQHTNRYNTRAAYSVKTCLTNTRIKIQQQHETVSNVVKDYLKQKQHQLELHSKTNQFMDPINVLNRGYSLTLSNNKIIKEAKNLKEGDVIKTLMKKGSVESKVIKTRK